MQKINLRDLYPDTYKTDVFVDVAEEVLAAIRGHQQDDAAYERRKFRHKAHYSLNREDGIESDAINLPKRIIARSKPLSLWAEAERAERR